MKYKLIDQSRIGSNIVSSHLFDVSNDNQGIVEITDLSLWVFDGLTFNSRLFLKAD